MDGLKERREGLVLVGRHTVSDTAEEMPAEVGSQLTQLRLRYAGTHLQPRGSVGVWLTWRLPPLPQHATGGLAPTGRLQAQLLFGGDFL